MSLARVPLVSGTSCSGAESPYGLPQTIRLCYPFWQQGGEIWEKPN